MDYHMYHLLKDIQLGRIGTRQGIRLVTEYLETSLLDWSNCYTDIFERYYSEQRTLLAKKNGAIAVAINRVIEENIHLENQIKEARRKAEAAADEAERDSSLQDVAVKKERDSSLPASAAEADRETSLKVAVTEIKKALLTAAETKKEVSLKVASAEAKIEGSLQEQIKLEPAHYDPSHDHDYDQGHLIVYQKASIMVRPGKSGPQIEGNTEAIKYPIHPHYNLPASGVVAPNVPLSVIPPNIPPRVIPDVASSNTVEQVQFPKRCRMNPELEELLTTQAMQLATQEGSKPEPPIPDPCIDSADNLQIALDFFRDNLSKIFLKVYDVQPHLNCTLAYQCHWVVYAEDETRDPIKDIWAAEKAKKRMVKDLLFRYVAEIDCVSIVSFHRCAYSFNVIVPCGCCKIVKIPSPVKDIPTSKAFPGQKTKSKGVGKSTSKETKAEDQQKGGEEHSEETRVYEHKIFGKRLVTPTKESKTNITRSEEKDAEKDNKNIIETEGVSEEPVTEARLLRKRRNGANVSDKPESEEEDSDSGEVKEKKSKEDKRHS